MSRAWSIYKGNNPFNSSFSASLRRAWVVEKAEIAYAAKKAEEAQRKAEIAERDSKRGDNWQSSNFNHAAIAEYYSTAPRGTYFGD